MRKKAGHPFSQPSSWLSQSSLSAKRLWTTRTTQVLPEWASTIHSLATEGASGPRFPDGDRRPGLHSGAEVGGGDAALALLNLAGDEPGRDAGRGRDGRPDLFRRPGDLGLDHDPAASGRIFFDRHDPPLRLCLAPSVDGDDRRPLAVDQRSTRESALVHAL